MGKLKDFWNELTAVHDEELEDFLDAKAVICKHCSCGIFECEDCIVKQIHEKIERKE